MAEVPAGLVAWARLPGPALVLQQIRDRAAKGADTERGMLRVVLTAEQRREVARVLGTPWELTNRAVRLQDLAVALAQHGLTVRGLVEGIDDQPLVNLRQRRADERVSAKTASERERTSVVELLEGAGVRGSAIQLWIDDPGLPKAGSGELLGLAQQVAVVWRQLPDSGGSISLAQLAANIGGNDAHALDYDRLLGRAAARLIAAQHRTRRPLRADRDWRVAWARAGVKCDGVSSRVLVLNLPLGGAAPAARWCAATPGEPVWLTLRSITGSWTAPSAATIFVCENVTVLEAAADRLSANCPPMVCTDGNPTNVALDLIAGLADAGCGVKVRADFDAVGLNIVDQVRSAAPAATDWRYDAATYAAHLGLDFDSEASDGNELEHLRALFRRHGIAVHEEAMLDQLMADLDQACLPVS